MRKPRFNRKAEFVFVRQTRLTAKIIAEPGDSMPEGTRLWRLRSLYDRGRIGMVGNAWTEEMLANGFVLTSTARTKLHNRHARKMSGLSMAAWDRIDPQLRNSIKQMHPLPGTEEPEVEYVEEGSGDADLPPPPDDEDEALADEPLHVGGGWYEVEVDGEIQKVQGKEAAMALMK